MTNAVLIVAAGRGSRMGADTPKQYLELSGRPILYHTITALLASDQIDLLRVVIHPNDKDFYDDATDDISDPRLLAPVEGGATRAASVRRGLEGMGTAAPKNVLIHDAARPFCTPELITRVLSGLNSADGAFAALPVVDALWRVESMQATTPVDRNELWRAQTPQAFRYDAILQAHQNVSGEAADDVAVARHAGLKVVVVEGSEDNFKITRPADLDRAEMMLSHPRP